MEQAPEGPGLPHPHILSPPCPQKCSSLPWKSVSGFTSVPSLRAMIPTPSLPSSQSQSRRAAAPQQVW